MKEPDPGSPLGSTIIISCDALSPRTTEPELYQAFEIAKTLIADIRTLESPKLKFHNLCQVLAKFQDEISYKVGNRVPKIPGGKERPRSAAKTIEKATTEIFESGGEEEEQGFSSKLEEHEAEMVVSGQIKVKSINFNVTKYRVAYLYPTLTSAKI
ncbi:hypothetical protein PVAG01_11474 [Phlyctema vagabunda]|uniref:Uncharacterized protein n=1 Tax=Phlyctema vagabunda TaxID=108571 RepID=A0ABR4P2E7_9HELO